jgi:hypothetical protein
LGGGMTATGNPAPFNPRLIIAVVLVGLVGFVAMWALTALGPQLASGENARGHALSKSVAGFAGIVDLAGRSDMWVDVRREVVHATPLDADESSTLLVLTPDHAADPDDIAALIAAHGSEPVLLILPKWRLAKNSEKPGWAGAGFAAAPPRALIPEIMLGDAQFTIGALEVRAPQRAAGEGAAARRIDIFPGDWQVIKGTAGTPLLALPGAERSLLVRAEGQPHYILAEPDMVNNFTFASRGRARAALAVLDLVAEDAGAGGVAFDVTLNGIGGGGGFLKLAFVPPFIGITLCLIAAGLLALWQAARRFGPAQLQPRAIPISKLALIESSAELVAQTQREADAAAPWLRAQREAMARGLHAPAALSGDALDCWIDRRRPASSGDNFSALAGRFLRARTNDELLTIARDIHAIRKELLREH